MDQEKAKRIICKLILQYVMGNRRAECGLCEKTVRGREIMDTGRYCYDCDLEIHYNDTGKLCYCDDNDCVGCGTLHCGCIDACWRDCKFRDNDYYPKY